GEDHMTDQISNFSIFRIARARLRGLAAAGVAAAILASCGGTGGSGAPANASAAATECDPDASVTLAAARSLQLLDPTKTNGINSDGEKFPVYEPLIRFDPNLGTLGPGLATEWKFTTPTVFTL